MIAFIKECTDRKKARKQKDYLEKGNLFEKANSIYARENHKQAQSEDYASVTQCDTFKGLGMRMRGECSVGIILLFYLLQ